MTFSRRKNNPLNIGCSSSQATNLTWTCCVNAWKFFYKRLAFYFFNENSHLYRKWKHQLRPFQAQYFGKTAAMLFCPSCQNINLLWRFSLEYPGADENRIKTTQVQLSFIAQLKCPFYAMQIFSAGGYSPAVPLNNIFLTNFIQENFWPIFSIENWFFDTQNTFDLIVRGLKNALFLSLTPLLYVYLTIDQQQ